MNPIKKLILLLFFAATAGICGPVFGQTMIPDNNRYTLYPPLNFTGTLVECNGYLTWQKPQLPDGTTPAGLAGYYLYRNGVLRHYFPSGDSLCFYDYNMMYGTYIYTITANYDLTSYGFPGQFGESLPGGPVNLLINCSFSLPFYEPWDLGTFAFHSWSFIPSQGNWTINTGEGSPAPAVFFTGMPAIQNYDIVMNSLTLPGIPWVCANIYLEFDYQLTDIASGGTEKLIAECFVDNTWLPVIELKNEGSTGWIHQKIDISQVCGKQFRIGFKATGHHQRPFQICHHRHSKEPCRLFPAMRSAMRHTAGGYCKRGRKA